MSIISLLHYPDDERGRAAYAFDHANEHVKLTAQMADPSSYNLIRYLLDPMPPDGMTGATLWSMAHQQAHDDAANYFAVQPSLPLIDAPPEQAGPFQVFLFTNATEHAALAGAALASGH
jgi:hypothetical protein